VRARMPGNVGAWEGEAAATRPDSPKCAMDCPATETTARAGPAPVAGDEITPRRCVHAGVEIALEMIDRLISPTTTNDAHMPNWRHSTQASSRRWTARGCRDHPQGCDPSGNSAEPGKNRRARGKRHAWGDASAATAEPWVRPGGSEQRDPLQPSTTNRRHIGLAITEILDTRTLVFARSTIGPVAELPGEIRRACIGAIRTAASVADLALLLLAAAETGPS